eukprot:6199954-Pleurochrysis_carterae.AAC.6
MRPLLYDDGYKSSYSSVALRGPRPALQAHYAHSPLRQFCAFLLPKPPKFSHASTACTAMIPS